MGVDEIKIGMRVLTRFGLGTVTSDYWRARDRFTVKLDIGWEADFSAASLTSAPAKEG